MIARPPVYGVCSIKYLKHERDPMEKKIVNVPGHKQLMDEDGKPLVPISPAVIANGFVYVSGQPPFDYTIGKLVSGDIQVQTRQVLENVKEVLAAAGT